VQAVRDIFETLINSMINLCFTNYYNVEFEKYEMDYYLTKIEKLKNEIKILDTTIDKYFIQLTIQVLVHKFKKWNSLLSVWPTISTSVILI